MIAVNVHDPEEPYLRYHHRMTTTASMIRATLSCDGLPGLMLHPGIPPPARTTQIMVPSPDNDREQFVFGPARPVAPPQKDGMV
jgi:hypothetical protein